MSKRTRRHHTANGPRQPASAMPCAQCICAHHHLYGTAWNGTVRFVSSPCIANWATVYLSERVCARLLFLLSTEDQSLRLTGSSATSASPLSREARYGVHPDGHGGRSAGHAEVQFVLVRGCTASASDERASQSHEGLTSTCIVCFSANTTSRAV
jgi:hypothetical protein